MFQKHLQIFLVTILSFSWYSIQGSAPCPTQSTIGSIFSGHIIVGTQNSLITLDPSKNNLCYNYSLPYQFMRPPHVAIAIDEFNSLRTQDLFFSVKPILSQNKLSIPFIVRTYYQITRWSKISFYFFVEDRYDIQAGYYQVDTGRLGGCESGKSINVYLPFVQLYHTNAQKQYTLFLSGFQISTKDLGNFQNRSPFQVAIAQSFTNGSGLIVTFQATTITQVYLINLNYIVYSKTQLSIVKGSYIYDFENLPQIQHTPVDYIGRNYARIHGISGFVISNRNQEINFVAQWTGFKFQFNFGQFIQEVRYLSYSYFFITGSQCQNCPGFPITHEGKCINQCPSGTFLTKENICINCGPNMYWNGTSCQKSCPQGQFLNHINNQCECPSGSYWTGKNCLSCSQGRIFNHKTKACQCPQGRIWNGYNCMNKVTCSHGKIWSIFTYSCECPSGTFWNGNICQRVIPCANGKISNSDGQCVCPQSRYWNGNYCEQIDCKGGQKWNGKQCVCESGLNFNGSFCIRCINGQYWDQNINNCVCQLGYIWNGNFCEKKQTCSGGRIWSNKYKQCICQQGKFWNGAQCKIQPRCCCGKKWNNRLQQCECERGFNWDGRTCVQCMNGKNWNQDKKICQCQDGTQWNGQFCIVVQSCYGGMMWNQNTWSCQCPSTTVWKNGYCIANPCTNGRVWDQRFSRCICPAGKKWINNTCLPPQLQCTGDLQWDNKTYSCRCRQNYWYNGKNCVPTTVCYSNQIYNPRNNKCQCPSGLIWLQSKKTCGDTTCPVDQMWDGYGCVPIKCPPNSYYNGSQCVCEIGRQKCEPWQYFDGYTCRYYKNQCPPSTIWKNGKCISNNKKCPDGNYEWNGKCISIPQLCPHPCHYDPFLSACKCPNNECPTGTYFSKNSCQPYEQCLGNQIFSNKYYQCMCPDEDNFNFNGQKCLTCQSNKVWVNIRGGKVCKCPDGYFQIGDKCEPVSNQLRCKNIPNSVWNINQHKCICEHGFSVVGFQCVCQGTIFQGKCQKCVHKPHSEFKFGLCQCKNGYFEDRGKCVDKGSGWKGNDTQDLCVVGTYFDDQQKKCLACPDGCLSCKDCYTCHQCRKQFYLQKQSKLCIEYCGDGQKFTLQCDDGNNNNGDGCSHDCKVEPGYTCRGGSPNGRDNCIIYEPDFVTILQTGQIRYSQSIILNLKLDYLPKQLLQSIQCENECSRVLVGQILSGQNAVSIKSSYIPGSTYSFIMQIKFGRPYIGEFKMKIEIDSSLQSSYFQRVKINKPLIIDVNPAYLSKLNQDTQDQLI